MSDKLKVECPCCEHESSLESWCEISDDSFLICPLCDYHEFKVITEDK